MTKLRKQSKNPLPKPNKYNATKTRIHQPCQHDWAYSTTLFPNSRQCRLCKRKESRSVYQYEDWGKYKVSTGEWMLLIEDINYENTNH